MTKYPPGTTEKPLSTAWVGAKVRDHVVPVIGFGKADDLIDRLNALETVADLRTLSPLPTAGGGLATGDLTP